MQDLYHQQYGLRVWGFQPQILGQGSRKLKMDLGLSLGFGFRVEGFGLFRMLEGVLGSRFPF